MKLCYIYIYIYIYIAYIYIYYMYMAYTCIYIYDKCICMYWRNTRLALGKWLMKTLIFNINLIGYVKKLSVLATSNDHVNHADEKKIQRNTLHDSLHYRILNLRYMNYYELTRQYLSLFSWTSWNLWKKSNESCFMNFSVSEFH